MQGGRRRCKEVKGGERWRQAVEIDEIRIPKRDKTTKCLKKACWGGEVEGRIRSKLVRKGGRTASSASGSCVGKISKIVTCA